MARHPDDLAIAALGRLLRIADKASGPGFEIGEARRAADFLLAWLDPEASGGFDLNHLYKVGPEIADDMLAVAGLIARRPDDLPGRFISSHEFHHLIAVWRPHLRVRDRR